MLKIGINVFIRLIFLSSISAIVVFTTSAKRFRKPCFDYNAREKHGVIKIKEMNKPNGDPCRNSNELDILQLKENRRNDSSDTNLVVCAKPMSSDFVLQFKGTITRVVSRHGMAEVFTCRHVSDTMIIRTNFEIEGNLPSYIAVRVRQDQNMNHFGVLSILDENNYKRKDTYELELPRHKKHPMLKTDELKHRRSRAGRSVKQRKARHVSNKNSTYKPTETSECGVSRACFRLGSDSCSHFQCLYYLSYTVNKDKVDIELSGKTSGWIAVGFSPKDEWNGSDVVACVRDTKASNGVKVTELTGSGNNRPVKTPSLSNVIHSDIRGSFLYCRVMLPIARTSQEETVSYTNLNNELYQLYARGSISEDNEILSPDHADILKSAKKISIYNNKMNVQNTPLVKQPSPLYQHSFITEQSECGVNRGCFRHGSTSCSHFECLYYLSYKVNTERDKVDIELSGKTKGWLAVGFSSDNKMGGDDIIACQRIPQTGGVKVVAYSDPLPRQRPEEKPSQANITHVESRDDFIYCRMMIPITRKPTDARSSYLDLSNEWYQLYAKGMVSSAGNMLQHIETPMTSTGQLTILRNTVNVRISRSSNIRASGILIAFVVSFLLLNFFPA